MDIFRYIKQSLETNNSLDIFEYIERAFSLEDRIPFDLSVIKIIKKQLGSNYFSDYDRPIYVCKSVWNELGDLICNKEKMLCNADPLKYITLRLDIKNMSKIKTQIFGKGWSNEFAIIMCKIAARLCQEFNASFAYTQSDEITILIEPSKNESFTHQYSGRRDKLISLSAAIASSIFNWEIREILDKKYIEQQYSLVNNYPNSMKNAMKSLYEQSRIVIGKEPVVFFDCRMAVWDSLKDAFGLILWRAYDCGVNGLSDAVYNFRINGDVELPSRKIRSNWDSGKKLKFLSDQGLLPLHPHQAYGSLFLRTKKEVKGYNPKENKYVTVQRKVISILPSRNIINALKCKEFFVYREI